MATNHWLRVAHRGASGSAPEHTRAAFERALEIGVDMIELDVQLSRDCQLVVMHDLDLERTTNGNGAVRNCDLDELRRLDCGSWFSATFCGATVLTLGELLTLVGSRARLNVELKAPHDDWDALMPRLIATLEEHSAVDSTIVSCFAPEALARLRTQHQTIPLGLLWHQTDFTEAWRWARELQAVSLHPHWMLVNPDLLAKAQEHGLDVITWTVNDPATMRELVDYGVDGIISDHPERFAEVGHTNA